MYDTLGTYPSHPLIADIMKISNAISGEWAFGTFTDSWVNAAFAKDIERMTKMSSVERTFWRRVVLSEMEVSGLLVKILKPILPILYSQDFRPFFMKDYSLNGQYYYQFVTDSILRLVIPEKTPKPTCPYIRNKKS